MASLKLAVNGTLMRGLELSRNMTDAGAEFVREATTEPCYRMWSIGDVHPAMQKASSGGAAIALEVWDVPPGGLISILLNEPPGLCRLRYVAGNRLRVDAVGFQVVLYALRLSFRIDEYHDAAGAHFADQSDQ